MKRYLQQRTTECLESLSTTKKNKFKNKSLSGKKSRLSQGEKVRDEYDCRKSSKNLKKVQHQIYRNSFSLGRIRKKKNSFQTQRSKELNHNKSKKNQKIKCFFEEKKNKIKKSKKHLKQSQNLKSNKIKEKVQSQKKQLVKQKGKNLKKKKQHQIICSFQKKFNNFNHQEYQKNYQQSEIILNPTGDFTKKSNKKQLRARSSEKKLIKKKKLFQKYHIDILNKYIISYINYLQYYLYKLESSAFKIQQAYRNYKTKKIKQLKCNQDKNNNNNLQFQNQKSIQHISKQYETEQSQSNQSKSEQNDSNEKDQYKFIVQQQKNTKQLIILIQDIIKTQNEIQKKNKKKKIMQFLISKQQKNIKTIIQNIFLKENLKEIQNKNVHIPQMNYNQKCNFNKDNNEKCKSQKQLKQQSSQQMNEFKLKKKNQIQELKKFKQISNQLLKKLPISQTKQKQQQPQIYNSNLKQKQQQPKQQIIISQSQKNQKQIINKQKFNQKAMMDIIKMRESTLSQKHKLQINIIQKMCISKMVSPKSYQNKINSIQKWIQVQNKGFHKSKRYIQKGLSYYSDIIKNIQKDMQLLTQITELEKLGKWQAIQNIINMNMFKSDSSSEFSMRFKDCISQGENIKIQKFSDELKQQNQNGIKILDMQIQEKNFFSQQHNQKQKVNFNELFNQNYKQKQQNNIINFFQNTYKDQEKITYDNVEKEIDLMTNDIIILLSQQKYNNKLHQQQNQNKKLNNLITSKQKTQHTIYKFETSLNFVKSYLIAYSEFIRQKFCDQFLRNINNPLNLTIKQILSYFHLDQCKNYVPIQQNIQNPSYPYILNLYQKQNILKERYFYQFNNFYDKLKRHQKIINQQTKIYQEYHLRLLHDIFNQQLDQQRPFGAKCISLPWKPRSNVLLKNYPYRISPKMSQNQLKLQLDKLFGISIARIIKIGSFLCGFIPQTLQDGAQQQVSQSYLAHIKESRLNMMLQDLINECEQTWLIYDLEQTVVILQISNIIVNFLIEQAIINIKKNQIKRNLII